MTCVNGCGGGSAMASHWCVECGIAVCGLCVSQHGSRPESETHTLREIVVAVPAASTHRQTHMDVWTGWQVYMSAGGKPYCHNGEAPSKIPVPVRLTPDRTQPKPPVKEIPETSKVQVGSGLNNVLGHVAAASNGVAASGQRGRRGGDGGHDGSAGGHGASDAGRVDPDGAGGEACKCLECHSLDSGDEVDAILRLRDVKCARGRPRSARVRVLLENADAVQALLNVHSKSETCSHDCQSRRSMPATVTKTQGRGKGLKCKVKGKGNDQVIRPETVERLSQIAAGSEAAGKEMNGDGPEISFQWAPGEWYTAVISHKAKTGKNCFRVRLAQKYFLF